jgi:hypothetical protein
MSKRSEEKRAYWRSMLERQLASGLNVRQFCKEERISEASFHNWKSKLAGGGRKAKASSERGGRKRPTRKQLGKRNDNAAVFIPLRVSAAAGNLLEIVHPRGYVVRVPAVFDEGALGQVLDLLDRPGGR